MRYLLFAFIALTGIAKCAVGIYEEHERQERLKAFAPLIEDMKERAWPTHPVPASPGIPILGSDPDAALVYYHLTR